MSFFEQSSRPAGQPPRRGVPRRDGLVLPRRPAGLAARLTGFLFRERRADGGPTVGELWGEPQEHEERPNVIERPRPPPRLEARGERQAAATAF